MHYLNVQQIYKFMRYFIYIFFPFVCVISYYQYLQYLQYFLFFYFHLKQLENSFFHFLIFTFSRFFIFLAFQFLGIPNFLVCHLLLINSCCIVLFTTHLPVYLIISFISNFCIPSFSLFKIFSRFFHFMNKNFKSILIDLQIAISLN